VRESIQWTLGEAGVNREVADAGLDERREDIRRRDAETKAQAELAELKRARREVLVPLNAPTAVPRQWRTAPAVGTSRVLHEEVR
jgi:hypothetical protein